MNKKTVSKVNLFFDGLVSRMEENKDFFNDITINLKSGTKNFPAKILYTDDITLDYQAVKRNVEKDDLWDIIAEELLKYDEAQIIYSERGAKIVIDANDKKVNMRHEDVTKEINKTSVVQTGREYVVNPALAKDLLEEIVGEIRDEYDKDETEPFIKLADNVYRVSASYKLDDINDAIGTNLHSDENDSIGGYIIEQLDRFPKRGDRLKTGNIEFIIEHATKARIVSIIMKIKQS